eukprot:127811-Rhodomonas_salina.2
MQVGLGTLAAVVARAGRGLTVQHARLRRSSLCTAEGNTWLACNEGVWLKSRGERGRLQARRMSQSRKRTTEEGETCRGEERRREWGVEVFLIDPAVFSVSRYRQRV